MQFEVDYHIGKRRIPYLGMSIEQLILILYPTLLLSVIFLWQRDMKRRKRYASTPPGCTRLGSKGKSHMADEFDNKYTTSPSLATGISETTQIQIKSLFMYPIKSCQGIETDVADVDGSGILWDRKFAFAELLTPHSRPGTPAAVQKPKWTFRTLRQPGWERLVHVKPEIWTPDNTKATPYQISQTGGVMIVRFPFVASGPLASLDRLMVKLGLQPADRSFVVPLTPPKGHSYPSEEVIIWKDSPRWLNYGQHVPDDFRQYMGVKNPLTLFRADPEALREVHRNAPRREQVGYQPSVGFQDAYPLHLLNLASVHDVGARVKHDIPRFSARRFRSNFVITGPPAYGEDDWKRIRVGQHEFHCACHTVRCRLPNVDPDTSARHPVEPDKTLKSFRCIDDGDPLNACLGLQLVPATPEKIQIRVGDHIEILERGEHHYIKQ